MLSRIQCSLRNWWNLDTVQAAFLLTKKWNYMEQPSLVQAQVSLTPSSYYIPVLRYIVESLDIDRRCQEEGCARWQWMNLAVDTSPRGRCSRHDPPISVRTIATPSPLSPRVKLDFAPPCRPESCDEVKIQQAAGDGHHTHQRDATTTPVQLTRISSCAWFVPFTHSVQLTSLLTLIMFLFCVGNRGGEWVDLFVVSPSDVLTFYYSSNRMNENIRFFLLSLNINGLASGTERK